MKSIFLSFALCASSFAFAQSDQTAFPVLLDVPPCVYAAEAVGRLTALGILQGFPTTPAELARNAVRQVFEGLRCGDVAWTTRFLAGVPQGYAAGVPTLGAPLKGGFEFTALETRVDGNRATVRYRLRYGGGAGATERGGSARLIPDADSGWRVEFASLQEGELPFFPR